MREPAGKFGTMNPMVEYHRRKTCFFGEIVQDHLAVIIGERPLLHARLCHGSAKS